MKKNFVRIAEINARLRAIATAMKTEERDLTEAERGEVNQLEREKTYLTMQMSASLPGEEERALSKPELYKRGLRAIVAAGRNVELQVRETGTSPTNPTTTETPTTTATMKTSDVSAGALMPLTIGEVLMPLTEDIIYNKIGIRMPTGCRGSYEWPVVEAVEAQIAGEEEALDDQKVDLDKVATLTQRIGVSVSATRESLFNSDGKLESIIRQLLPAAIAEKMNKIILSPTKVNDKCAITGPFVGKTAKAVDLTFKALNAEKAALLAKGVKSQRMCWVMTEAVKAELEATPKDSGSGIMCIENDKLCGLPVFCHSAIGEGNIGLGDFTYQVAGQFGDVYFIVDPYTGAGSNKVKFTLNVNFGTATLRPEAFTLLKKKTA